MKAKDIIKPEERFKAAVTALGFSSSVMRSFFKMAAKWAKENEDITKSIEGGTRFSISDDWTREIAATKRETMKSLGRIFEIFYFRAGEALPGDLDLIVWRKKSVTNEVYNREVRKLRKAFAEITDKSVYRSLLLKHWRNCLDTKRVELALAGQNNYTPPFQQANAFLKILEGSAKKKQRNITKPKSL